MDTAPCIRPGGIVSGPTLPELVEVLAVVPMGTWLAIIGREPRGSLILRLIRRKTGYVL